MAAEDGDDVRMKRADEGNVSQDVEYLMTDKFVGEAQLREAFGLGVNDGVSSVPPLPRPIFLMASSSHVNPIVLAGAISFI